MTNCGGYGALAVLGRARRRLCLVERRYVQVDEAQRETSIPGIYAGGDLLTPKQGALLAAASGTKAAAMLNHALTVDLAITGALS